MKKILLDTFFYEMGLRGCESQSVLALNLETNQTELIEPQETPPNTTFVEYTTKTETDGSKLTFYLDKVSGLFRATKDCEQYVSKNERFPIDVLIYMLKQNFLKVSLVLDSRDSDETLVGMIRLTDKSGNVSSIEMDSDYLADSIDVSKVTYIANMSGCNVHQEALLSELPITLVKGKDDDQIQSQLLFRLRNKVVHVTEEIKNRPPMVFLA